MTKEICLEWLEKVCKGEEYIHNTKICIDLFNQLKEGLEDEQRKLLLTYEEAVAKKENIMIDSLLTEASL